MLLIKVSQGRGIGTTMLMMKRQCLCYFKWGGQGKPYHKRDIWAGN